MKVTQSGPRLAVRDVRPGVVEVVAASWESNADFQAFYEAHANVFSG